MVLIITSAVIGREQFNFSPALLSISSPMPDAGSNPGSILSQMALPAALSPLSPVEIFRPATLSDKINGKAELYLSAGFRILETRRFEISGNDRNWLEIFVYDMENAKNAFAVFSGQRRAGAAAGELGDHSYETENAFYLMHGPYYLEIIASSDKPEGGAAVRAAAEAFVNHVHVESGSGDSGPFFPQTGLSQESVALIAADAFGFERLDQVYTAQYRIDDVDLTAFISRRDSPQDAQDLASAYHAFLMQFGGEAVETVPGRQHLTVVSIMDSYEVIFADGLFLAGVHQAENLESALKLADILHKKLKEKMRES